ncbi:MAG: Zn-dependent metalloprotease [Myxococcota bacterium]|jgi:Zn-dependent metalloprotease
MQNRLGMLALFFLGGTIGCESSEPEPLFPTGGSAEVALATSLVQDHIDSMIGRSGLDGLQIERVFVDPLGMAHARVQQLEQGLKVLGGEAIIHLAPDGTVASVTDALVYKLQLDHSPRVSESDAVQRAMVEGMSAEALTGTPQAKLLAVRHDGADRLVWQVELERLDEEHAERFVVLIDAHTGEEVLRYNDIHTTAGTGTGTYSGSVSIDVSSSGSNYILYDSGRNVYTRDSKSRSQSFSRSSEITSSSTSFGSTDPEGIDAHYGLEEAYDYFSSTFGRDSFDDSGAQIQARVHYSRRYVNAFWDGSALAFGDGDGSNSDALTTIDIVAHEYTHAVTDYTANLTYSGESGALNEATSDIFAAAIEASVDGAVSADTWDIGEDCWTPRTSGDALRYMDNPTADGSSYDYYPTRYTGTSDNGGVHLNSGIANLAFYLASEGGSHPRGVTSTSVTGVGIDAAAKIWYRALTVYMTSSTDFSDARDATLDAATDLYGATSSQHAAWEDAWAAVGIGSGSGGGTDTGTPDTGTPDTGTPDTGTPGGLDCTGGTLVTGTLSASGVSETLLSSASAGTHSAELVGPSSADFDLYLYKQRKNGSWQSVGSSTSATSSESLSYSLSKTANLTWSVVAYSGSGDFELCVNVP